MKPLVTVVIPVKNECAGLETLCSRIQRALDSECSRWNVLFIDDDSSDGTFSKIQAICRHESRIKCLRLAESIGQERAILEGIKHCPEGAVIVMDGDLQDPPELLPQMLRRWQEGYDTVLTKRSSRKGEGWLKRLTARLFYMAVRAAGRESAEGNFYLIGEHAVRHIRGMVDPFPLLRLWIPSLAGRKTTLLFDRQPRSSGKSKYNYSKMWSLAMDGFTAMTLLPFRLGILVALLSIMLAAALAVAGAVYPDIPLPGRLLFFVSSLIFLFFSSITFLLCILGEYAGRLSITLRSPRSVSIRETVNMEEERPAARVQKDKGMLLN